MNGEYYLVVASIGSNGSILVGSIGSILEAVLQSLLVEECVGFVSGMQVDMMWEEACQWNRVRWEFVVFSFVPSQKMSLLRVILYPCKQTNIKMLTQLA